VTEVDAGRLELRPIGRDVALELLEGVDGETVELVVYEAGG
jgi:hypothetical protein